jgi:hypothetical protein
MQAGVELPQRDYTFDVRPRWALDSAPIS